jgi:ankyrin repeat protein
VKKIIFIVLIASSICFGFIVDAKAQLEDRKNCGKNGEDECFHTPLTIAARRGDIEQVKLLLAKGTLVDERNYFKRTALKEAIIRNKREVVKILIEAGANVNDKAHDWTPLGLALVASSEDIFKDLIFAGANYSERFSNGKTLLIAAASSGGKEKLAVLLFFGEDINATDKNGVNALMNAILGSYPPNPYVIKFLISKGININAVSDEGLTALDYVKRALKEYKGNKQAEAVYFPIIKTLEKAGAIENCN